MSRALAKDMAAEVLAPYRTSWCRRHLGFHYRCGCWRALEMQFISAGFPTYEATARWISAEWVEQ